MAYCNWATNLDILIAYHDTEWGVPLHDDRGQFEYLMMDEDIMFLYVSVTMLVENTWFSSDFGDIF